MAVGLVLYDLIYLILAAALYGGAASAASLIGREIAARAPWPVAVGGALVGGIVALILEVGVLTALLPRLKPGRYTLMRGAVFYGWILRSLLRRILFLPGLKSVIFSSNVLRFLALRALGAKVAFTSSLSTDADLLDPALVTLGPGATVGARCLLSGHFVEGGRLVLGEVRVGERALLAAEVLVAPGVTVGARAVVKPRASLSMGAQVGEDAQVGGEVLLDAYARVGARAVLGHRSYVGPRVEVEAGARVEALARAESTTSSAAPAV